jgi:hypothetical protein
MARRKFLIDRGQTCHSANAVTAYSVCHLERESVDENVPRGGIEPPTRGFSVPVENDVSAENTSGMQGETPPFAAPVPQGSRFDPENIADGGGDLELSDEMMELLATTGALAR